MMIAGKGRSFCIFLEMHKTTWILAVASLLAVVTVVILKTIHYSDFGTGWKSINKRANIESGDCRNTRTLIISFDGFRWNYLNRTKTPNFSRFIHNGVHARYGLKNAFITKTFPNHYTLVTGLWEESHNIVANRMYDPDLNETFSFGQSPSFNSSIWYDAGGEPIWVTNQLKGNGHSGIIMWVGGNAKIHNVLPQQYIPFNLSVKNETKIDTMIRWFQNDCQMNLGLMYFAEPDEVAHEFGPDSDQVTRMIGGLDKVIGYLLKKFLEADLLNNTNIILTSDHGFASTPEEKRLYLDDILDPQKCLITSKSPVAGIWPHPGYFEEIYNNLTNAAAKNGNNFIVYKKEEIPEQFHYKHSRRVPPLLAVAKEFYSFHFSSSGSDLKGEHGYDNRLQDMHPFFVAMGPAFKSGFAVDSFNNVDVYPLMCHLLGIQPSPNNGSMEIVSSLLKPTSPFNWRNVKYIIISILVVIILTILVLGVVFYIRNYCHKTKKEEPAIEEDEEEEAVLYTNSSDTALVPLL